MRRILNTTAIPKPARHEGDQRTDYFLVDLDVSQAEQIMEHLIDAELIGFFVFILDEQERLRSILRTQLGDRSTVANEA
jgi:hypothetical protein